MNEFKISCSLFKFLLLLKLLPFPSFSFTNNWKMKRYIEIWYEVVEMNMWLESEKSNRKIYQVILHYNICSIREIDPY